MTKEKHNLNQPTKKEFQKTLGVLGTTPKQIAAKLEEMGIKGWRGALDACPIYNYLSMSYNNVIMVVPAEVIFSHLCHCYLLPKHVKMFIKQFDKGYYPNLDMLLDVAQDAQDVP